MILRITLLVLLLHQTSSSDDKCLTGDMTDVQSWVDANGNIIAKDSHKQDNTVDVSFNQNPAAMIRSLFSSNTRRDDSPVIYLTMAKCRMRTVPPVFDLDDPIGSQIARTLEFMTLFGNNFQDFGINNLEYEATINASDAREVSFGEIYGRMAETTWPKGFRNTTFSKLRQLDLRSCSIQTLDNNVFQGMPLLEALYISGNNIFFVSSKAFAGLKNLLHLDLSRNEVLEKGEIAGLYWEAESMNNTLSNLVSLDLSYTRISRSTVQVIGCLGKQFERLSLCYTNTKELKENFFNKTSLKILDVSGNNGILNEGNVLGGIEDTLEVIYADNIGLTSLHSFEGFKNIKIMRAGNNFVRNIGTNVTNTMKNLEILSLDYNRMTTWFEPLFKPLENLKLLSLRHNNINVINSQMIEDMSNITYIGLSGNFFVCSCHVRDFYNVALDNDMRKVKEVILKKSNKKFRSYHNGYEYFNELMKNRVSMNRSAWETMDFARYYKNYDGNLSGNFVLYDYGENAYKCLIAHEGRTIDFRDAQANCLNKYDNSYDEIITYNINKLILIVAIPTIITLLSLIGYYFRRTFKYFYITLRNSAMLSLISDGKEINEGTIFNYDVFVSYCNEDRAWVLDKLLPQMEKDCSVSVCLHERDFQVGLSILENIVSCMDRSRSIMLIISQRFLLSQWCQFEMHLAQHRLLETRREDLILVLLEDIPRRLRPNTLHYLMLSKTYVQYPEDPNERPAFWRRLKKCFVTQKFRQIENVSLA